MTPQPPPHWTPEQFEADRQAAIGIFRTKRAAELLDVYSENYEAVRQVVADLLELTLDLTDIESHVVQMTTGPGMLEVLRYVASPPISSDDLVVLANVDSLAPGKLAHESSAKEVVATVFQSLDPNRFPWIREQREASEPERETAIVATASMIAYRRVLTLRANESKNEQELATRKALTAAGFDQVPTRDIMSNGEAPAAGSFCAESNFFGRKADIVATLLDGRFMPIECKVSNSSTNSIKRLNNDAAAKARHWIEKAGSAQTVPVAVIAGVYKLRNLEDAQGTGLVVFWAHSLDKLAEFVKAAT